MLSTLVYIRRSGARLHSVPGDNAQPPGGNVTSLGFVYYNEYIRIRRSGARLHSVLGVGDNAKPPGGERPPPGDGGGVLRGEQERVHHRIERADLVHQLERLLNAHLAASSQVRAPRGR
eukprot:1179993-Prorocentrum_minimum.AAC.1